MPYKDKEKQREYFKNYARKWRLDNRERYLERYKKWCGKNRKKIRQYSRKFYWANREKEIIRIMAGNKKRYRRLRFEAIKIYGGKCQCCGENTVQFLAIDHKNKDGSEHRKELKKLNTNIYEWLHKNNYPKNFQILCHNCNCSKGYYGFCPHQIERNELTEDDLLKIELERNNKKGMGKKYVSIT